MMITTKRLSNRLATDKTTPSVRMIALMFAIVNTPGAIIGTLFWYVLPVSIWGIILYVCYWRIFADKMKHEATLAVWIWTMVYNALLIIGFLAFTEGAAWPLALFNLAAIGFAYVAVRNMLEERVGER